MNSHYRIMIFTVMLSVSLTASAEKVYEKTGKEGVPEFSDQPSPGAKKIEVKPNVVEIVPARRITPSPPVNPAKKKTSPSIDETGPGVIVDGEERRRKARHLKEKHERERRGGVKGGHPGSGAIRGGGRRR